MRFSWKTLVAVAAAVLVVPQLAAADDVQDQLRDLQERIGQLEGKLEANEGRLQASEDKLRAADDQLAEANRKVESNQQLFEESGLTDRAGSSALMNFASKVVFDGFVAASYTFNANYPGAERVDYNNAGSFSSDYDSENGGALGMTAPYHQSANAFQLDQLWFGMEKPATAESRGGFRADIVFGAAADINGFAADKEIDDNGEEEYGTGDLPHVYQAYAQYLAPIGNEGILIKAGRYESLLGAESFRADSNFNITRSLLFTLQPINHTGVLVEGGCGDCGIDWALGISNDYNDANGDWDNSKTGVGRVRWTGETASVAVAGLYGGNINSLRPLGEQVIGSNERGGEGRDADALPILDVVATWDPSENLSMWFNYTHIFDPIDDNISSEYNIYGFSGGGRLAITERTGIATRIDYVRGDDVFEEFLTDPDTGDWTADDGDPSSDMDMWAVTATIDHALTDNLLVKLEGRYDNVNVKGEDDEIFVANCDDNAPSCDDFEQQDQWLALIQMLYQF